MENVHQINGTVYEFFPKTSFGKIDVNFSQLIEQKIVEIIQYL